MGRIYLGRHVGLGTAMENDTPKEGDESELPEHADSVEAQLAEVAEDAAAVDQHNERVEEAIDGAESLEAMCVTLSAAMEAGGLDPHAADLMNQHAQYILDRTGFDSKRATMALESFGAVSDRVHSTNVALESIKDTVRTMWDKIIEALKKAIEWVSDMYNKVFGAAEGLVKRARKIATAAEAAGAKQRDKDSFENESLAQKLVIGNAINLTTGLDRLKKCEISAESTASKDKFNNLVSTIGDFANGNTEAAVDVQKHLVDIVNSSTGFKFTVVSNPSSEGFKVAKDAKVERTDEMPGRMAVISITAGDYVHVSLGKYKPNNTSSVNKTLKTLSTSDIISFADSVEELAQGLQGFRKDENFRRDTKKKLLEHAKKISEREIKDDETSEQKEAYRTIRRGIVSIANAVDEPAASIARYIVMTCQAVLAYCELSLRQYK